VILKFKSSNSRRGNTPTTLSLSVMSSSPLPILSKERLDLVVRALKSFMASEDIRALSHREIQSQAWHSVMEIAGCMADLRKAEEMVRRKIMEEISKLVYRCNAYILESKSQMGVDDSSYELKIKFRAFCLDSKERLYLILKKYGWLPDFFRQYPHHFYENSFHFIYNIPEKTLPIKVRVVGLGIAGSLAVSGLAKSGIESVVGFEKRLRDGPSSVSSRYQNASWRAYDIAKNMLDEAALARMKAHQQWTSAKDKTGNTAKVVCSDRVQIIIGDAIETAIASALRYKADLQFGCGNDAFYDGSSAGNPGKNANDKCDIVALFCGAHTSKLFPGLEEQMEVITWPNLSSRCLTWLRIQESAHHANEYCRRGGEIGAEKWHFTIETARNTVQDIERVKDAAVKKLQMEQQEHAKRELKAKLNQIEKVLKFMGQRVEGNDQGFDYVFTNAPENEHNISKRDDDGNDGSVVIDGNYTVDVSIASKAIVGGVSIPDYHYQLSFPILTSLSKCFPF
jgi:hypothetical protein